MPPEKYIVNVIKKFKKRRAQKRVRESGYAASFGSVKREGFRIKFGAVKVSELRRLGIEKLVWAGELSFRDDVVSRKRKTQKYEPFSQFPAAVRDLSVIVDSSKSAAELCSDISKIVNSTIPTDLLKWKNELTKK